MALGCTTFSITRRISRYEFSKSGKVILGILEVVCYFIVFRYACTEMDVKYSFPVIFVLWIAVILTFSDINPLRKVFDNEVCMWLGRVSLLIYLNQFYGIRLMQEYLAKECFVVKVIACTAITFAGAFLSGKTTLLSLLTAQNPATEGEITLDGQPVWENEEALSHICYSREISPLTIFGPNTTKVKAYLATAKAFYKNWDQAYADELVKLFNINVKKRIKALYSGYRHLGLGFNRQG